MSASRPRLGSSVRRTVTVALAAVLAVTVAQPVTYAATRREAVSPPADPDPQFLAPGTRPTSSVVHPAPPATTPGDDGADRAANSNGKPAWETHPESRARSREAAILAAASGQRVVVTDELAEDSTTYANPDGTVTTALTSGPRRVRRGDGWTDIDTTLVRRGNRLEAAAIVGRLSLSAGGDGELLTLGRGAHAFSLGWPGQLPEPRVHGATAVYADVLPGADLTVRALRYGFEQSLVVRQRPSAPLVYELPLRLPTGQSARQAGGHIELTDAHGAVVGVLPQAVMFDAARDPRSDEPLRKELVPTRLVETADGLAVRYAPDAGFLAHDDTVFPVTIDPPATLGIVSDTDVDSGFPTTPYAGSSELRVGTHNSGANKLRSYLTFGTSKIAGKTILSASLKLYNFHSWSCQERELQIYRSTSTTNSTTTWDTKPANSLTVFDSPYPAFAFGYSNTSTCSARWHALKTTELVQAWANLGESSSTLMLKAGSETDNYYWKKFYSGNTSMHYPEIEVTYNSVPVVTSPSPASGTVLKTTTPSLSGVVTDADGGTVKGQFYIKDSAGAWVSNGYTKSGDSGTRIAYVVEAGKLKDGQTYTWYMRGCDAVECSATTAQRTFTVTLGAPSAPTNVTATAGDSTTTVTWGAPDDNGGSVVTGYRCDVHKASTGAVHSTSTVGPVTSCTDGTVTNGTSYFWRVYAINAIGTGPYAESPQVKPSRAPSAPRDVVATAGDASSTVTWNEPEHDGGAVVTHYSARLYQSGTGTLVYTSPAIPATSTRTASKDALTNGVTYHWTVVASNGPDPDDTSSAAKSNDVTPAGRPGAPSAVDATEQTRPGDVVQDPANPPSSVSYTVVWTPPGSNGGAAIDEYLVQAYEMPANAAVLPQPVSACGTCDAATVSGLKPDRRYVFGVVARNRVDTGAEGRSQEKTSHLPPRVAKTVEYGADSLVERAGGTEPLASRGDTVRFTVTVTNTQSQDAQVESVVDTLPPGVQVGTVTVDGVPCGSGCALSGQTLTLSGGYVLAGGATRTYQYVGVLTGSERACVMDAANTVVASGPYGLDDGVASTTTCGSALGLEPWWTYLSYGVAAQSAASVNVANGNLVVQATDSAPVQGHGRLAYVVRRSYNSQDVTLADLPGSLGAGWSFNVGQTSDLAASGVTATGLRVPRVGDQVAALTQPLSVTLIDRDGTRHLFPPKTGLPGLRVSALTGAAAALAPATLSAPAGKELCVDQAYEAPAGVQLGLWRYVAVDTSNGNNPCGDVGTGQPVVVGYAAMRPDRLRTEFSALGQLTEMRDAAGVALRYTYEPTAPTGPLGRLLSVYEPRSCTPDATNSGKCRQLAFAYPSAGVTVVTDPAGRRTRYEFGQVTVAGVAGPVKVLHRVVNDPEIRGLGADHVDYSYQGDSDTSFGPTSCGGSALQLCSITDARGARTELRYDTAGSGAAGLAGIGRVDRVTDRLGTVTTVAYPAADRTVAVRGGTQQRAFSAIDAYGRVGQQADGPVGDVTSATYPALHLTTNTWAGDNGCVGSAGTRDNNLCRRVRHGSKNAGRPTDASANTPDEVTEWRFDDQGQVLRERRVHQRASGAPATSLDTTSGYRTQYLSSDSAATTSTPVATSSTGLGGTVTTTWSAPLDGLVSLYAVSDRIESLTPRGNAAGTAAAAARYRTHWVVDADPAVAPGAAPAGDVCGRTADAVAYNTGLACAERTTYGAESETTVAETKHVYDAFGQKTRKYTARNGEYQYLYLADSALDLSGSVSAGGWLKAVTDPAGKYVVFAHDRGGNVVRTWDRDVTSATAYGSAAAFPVAAGVAGFAETRYAAGSFTDAIAAPWRFPRRQQTPSGAVTRFDVDQHGNVGRLVPPRGRDAATSPYDIVTTYDPDGRPRTVKRAQDAQSTMRYDAFGNLVEQRDPSGTPTLMAYDEVNRLVKRTTLRGPDPGVGTRPPACAVTAAGDAVFGAGQLVCHETTAYDTVDNVNAVTDRDGQPTVSLFDSVHRRTVTLTPRSGDQTPRSEAVYDADGRVVVACSPRQFPGGAGTCDASSVYATHSAYDVAGRVVATTVHRTAAEALTTRTTYDAEGNATSVAPPRQATETGDHTVDQSFDLLGRRTTVAVPRAGVTTFQYSASGDLLAEIAPGAPGDNVGSGGAGRSVRITAHTYDRDHRQVDTVHALQVAAADPAADPAAVAAAAGTAVTDEAGQTNIRTRRVYDEGGNVVATFNPRAFAGAPLAAPDKRFMLRTAYDESDRPVTQWAPRADRGAADDLTDDPTQDAHCPLTGAPAAGDPLAYPENLNVCVSTMAYDTDGRAAQVTLPSAAGDLTPRRLVYAYTEDGLVSETKAPNPAADDALVTVSATLHDGVGRPVKTTNAQGHVTLTAYTADSLVKSVQAPSAPGLTHETEYAYDENGNRTKEVTPRQSAGDRPYTETTYYADNRVRAIYAGGNEVVPAVRGDIVTSYDYDANGNPTAVTSPSANAKDANNLHGEPTRNQYTPDNLLLTTTQPVVVNATGVVQSRVTRYGYDAAGRKTSVDVDLTGTPAVDGAPQTFTYFPTGLVETETGRGGGDSIARGYDATGALVSAVDSDGATSRTTTAGYYLDGLPRQVVSDGRVTGYAYDGSGARTALGEGASGQPLSVTRYTVNDAGLPVSMTSPDSGTIGWAYNKLGQVVTETRGQRTQVWTYRADDLLGRTAVASTASLAEQVRDGSAAADLASYSYEYDELGRQTEQSFYGKSAGSPVGDVLAGAPVSYTYAYDRAGRLSSFTDARGTRTLTFDHNGNRTAYGTGVQPGATSFAYRADDSIATSATGLTTRTYQYADPFGGVTHDGCAAYGYDGLDRLTLVDTPASPPAGCPGGDVAYRYDGLDRQVRRTADGTTVSLHYDGLGQTTLLQAGAPAGTLHHTISPSGTVLTARRGTGATEHLADDGTGSTGLVTAADSTVLCTARYDAYGSPDGNTAVEPTGSCNTGTAQNDVFYRGNRKDTTTGQYQLGSRTYDPAKAGFLTPDTYRTGDPAQNLGIGTDPLTRNTYAYVNGDPINYTDPSGHEPRPVRRNGKTTWTGNGCATGDCTPEAAARRDARSTGDRLETARLNRAVMNGRRKRVHAELGRLVEWRGKDRNAYWDAVYRDCDQYKEPAISPGGRICEALYVSARALEAAYPGDDGRALFEALLGIDEFKKCFDGEKASCAWAAVGFVPLGKVGGLAARAARLEQLAQTGRTADIAGEYGDDVARQVDDALERARLGKQKFPGHDGKVWDNRNKDFPDAPYGYYREWTAVASGRWGPRVIIAGSPINPDAIFFWDHVDDFIRIYP